LSKSITGHTKFSRGPRVETPNLDHHILELRMCVCVRVYIVNLMRRLFIETLLK